MRTPLAAILGWTQVLRHQFADDTSKDLREGLEIIERNARMQTQLIEDLLDMSRIAAGKIRLDVQPVAPLAFIEAALETVRPAAQAKGIQIEQRLDPAARPVSGDPARLQQVIWNLLSNAIKFTPQGGKVRISLERLGSQVEISVADTGIGIEAELLPKLFRRFTQADASTTRRYGGLGLGLAIVKQLVEMHGGTIEAKSGGRDAGSEFRLRFPLSSPPEPRATLEADTPARKGRRILLVEDNVDAAQMLSELLEVQGHQVTVAETGTAALEHLRRRGADVAICDVGLPDMTGYELGRAIRAEESLRGIYLVALTGYGQAEDRARSREAGFDQHLVKPVRPDVLDTLLEQVRPPQ
jgi:CheY-like chemotaxis protein